MSARPTAPGFVSLVGAGPGDPELLTLRAARRIGAAEVVVHDRLVHPQVIALAPPRALRIDAGKRRRHHRLRQRDIHRVLIDHARAGRTVVRLKGGDPYLFGRGGEEAAALAAAGVDFEVVPGVSSALAAPAAAGIPVTHRGVARSLAILTASGRDGADGLPDDTALRAIDTLVVLMGVKRLPWVVASLLRAGRPPETPAAVVESATLSGQRVLRATLAELPAVAARAAVRSPAAIVVGEVTALATAEPDSAPAARTTRVASGRH